VASLDPVTGAFTQVRLFGGNGNTFANGIAADSQGFLYLTGGFQNTVDFGGHVLTASGGPGDTDAFVVKLTPNLGANTLQAIDQGGPGGDVGTAIAVVRPGSVTGKPGQIAVTGAFEQTAQFPPFGPLTSFGGNDTFVESMPL
jgi:hypothetical protein